MTTTTRLRRLALTALAALPWSAGWLAGWLVTAITYAVAAVRVGYHDARQAAPGTGRGAGQSRAVTPPDPHALRQADIPPRRSAGAAVTALRP